MKILNKRPKFRLLFLLVFFTFQVQLFFSEDMPIVWLICYTVVIAFMVYVIIVKAEVIQNKKVDLISTRLVDLLSIAFTVVLLISFVGVI